MLSVRHSGMQMLQLGDAYAYGPTLASSLCNALGKQWSIAKRSGPSGSRLGMRTCALIRSISFAMPSGAPSFAESISLPPPPTSGHAHVHARAHSHAHVQLIPTPPGRAATPINGASANLVVESVFWMRAFIRSRSCSRDASGSVSILFRTTMSVSLVISPMTRHCPRDTRRKFNRALGKVEYVHAHACLCATGESPIPCLPRVSPCPETDWDHTSAVCVWMPFPTSIISIIKSIICAPPMIVRMSDACPGQSTSVTCN